MSDTLVITGSGGQLGRYLAEVAGRQGRRVRAYSSAQWDITAVTGTPQLNAGDVVVNCAAFTNVDAAEDDAQRAFAVNATGPGLVAQACAAAGARLIHISTDYVFGAGSSQRPYEPGDPTAPCNLYGRSKLAGEQEVLAALPTATVVRTSWVYTGVRSDFVAVMAAKAAAGEAVDVVADQIGSPTYVGDLVAALLSIVDKGVSVPVVHAGGAGEGSRFEQARAVYAALGADVDLVRPARTADVPRRAVRPSYSALGLVESVAAGMTPLRPWRDGLAEALGQRPIPSTP